MSQPIYPTWPLKPQTPMAMGYWVIGVNSGGIQEAYRDLVRSARIQPDITGDVLFFD